MMAAHSLDEQDHYWPKKIKKYWLDAEHCVKHGVWQYRLRQVRELHSLLYTQLLAVSYFFDIPSAQVASFARPKQFLHALTHSAHM